jgi:serine/threonine-protein kinase
MRFEAGSVFAGYTVISRLGRGGMATVYLVREPGIDRLVALKVLPEQLVDEVQFSARFEQEARLIGGLDHPNIIPLYRYGITDDVPWMALRYVDGGDFAARLAARPLPVAEGLSILRGVAGALDYAHHMGVIHRDLKPQNILLTHHGAYLADFGVAKMLEGASGANTAAGDVLGSPSYMAPEQAQGGRLGPYTDVYALAVICFQWLTGTLPFDADTPHAILLKHIKEPLPTDALGLLAPNVAAVLEHGLAKQPEQRFQSASALIAELEKALYSASTLVIGIPTQTQPLPPSSPQAATPEHVAAKPLEPALPVVAPTTTPSRSWKWIGLLALAMGLAIGGYVWRQEMRTATDRQLPADGSAPISSSSAPAPGASTAPHRPSQDAKFADLGGGVMKDTRSGLEWTQRDNGSDINWNDATRYCASKKNGWRLPNLDELAALYDTNDPSSTPCGTSYACKTSSLFHLTKRLLWSGTTDDSAHAWLVDLYNGAQTRTRLEDATDDRALCVRGAQVLDKPFSGTLGSSALSIRLGCLTDVGADANESANLPFWNTKDNGGKPLCVLNRIYLTSSDVGSVRADVDEASGRPVLRLTLKPEGAQRMTALTSENLNRRLVYVLDGKILIAATIMSPVNGDAELTGMDPQQIQEIASRIEQQLNK